MHFTAVTGIQIYVLGNKKGCDEEPGGLGSRLRSAIYICVN